MLALLLSLKRELAWCLRPGQTLRRSSRQTAAYLLFAPCMLVECCLVAIIAGASLQTTICSYVTFMLKLIFKFQKEMGPVSVGQLSLVVDYVLIVNVSHEPCKFTHLQHSAHLSFCVGQTGTCSSTLDSFNTFKCSNSCCTVLWIYRYGYILRDREERSRAG